MSKKHAVLASVLLSFPFIHAHALDVNITESLSAVKTVHENKEVVIQRIQDQENLIPAGFSKTSRKCPPFCIQPMHVAPGVTTVGELEVLDFITNKVNTGKGVLIDARTESFYKEGTIPGSINIPFTTFAQDSSDIVKAAALAKFGVTRKDGGTSLFESVKDYFSGNKDASKQWDFSHAKELLLWCNGMWCGQSPHAIKGLLELGYPPEKLFYYRDGMQAWLLLGFNIVKPGE
jgi:rhodanese-related sulfurtransferase